MDYKVKGRLGTGQRFEFKATFKIVSEVKDEKPVTPPLKKIGNKLRPPEQPGFADRLRRMNLESNGNTGKG